MKIEVTLNMFREAFKNAGRQDNFSHEGLEALFDYHEMMEEDTGEEIIMDVIGFCCDFSEVKSLSDFHAALYDAVEFETMEDIENMTQVIRVGEKGGFIFGNF